MTPDQFQTYLSHQKLSIQTEQRTADALELVVRALELKNRLLQRIIDVLESYQSQPLTPPNYQLALESWTSFDWGSIGATVERVDSDGVAVVSWHGFLFNRRSPANKFGEAIWFSRCVGKDERGENQYEKLCTFKPLAKLEVEPLPDKVSRLVR